MLKYWLTAALAEVLALLLLLSPGFALALPAYLVLHGTASALAALAAGHSFPGPYRQPRRWVWLLLFGLNLFVPVLGLAITLLGVAGGSLFPQLLKPQVFEAVAAPEYTVTGDEALKRPRGAAARARLLDRRAPLHAREEALLAMGASTSPSSGNILRELLADPSDDLRLLAYGMLDRREKEISGKLARERTLLEIAESVDDRDAVRTICGRIATLYWELVYQGLAQGDTARFALEQTLIFAERSLRDDAGDGPTWLLIGRVRMQRGEPAAAERALAEALKYQVSRRSVLPYMAELRFAQGRYNEVRQTMIELGIQPGSETLAAVQEYWGV